MKTLVTILSLFIFANTYAQDIITLRDGEEINAQVIIISEGKIKYRLFQHKDTTTRSIPQVDVFMIKYAGGAKQVFDEVKVPADEAKLKRLLRPTQNDYEYYMARYKKKKTTGIVLTSIGAPVLVTGITLLSIGLSEGTNRYGNYGSDLITPGVMTSVGGFVFTLIGGINFAVMPAYKKKAQEAQMTLGFYPSVQPGTALYGPQSGLAMRITF